jgi:hypothetical protein
VEEHIFLPFERGLFRRRKRLRRRCNRQRDGQGVEKNKQPLQDPAGPAGVARFFLACGRDRRSAILAGAMANPQAIN